MLSQSVKSFIYGAMIFVATSFFIAGGAVAQSSLYESDDDSEESTPANPSAPSVVNLDIEPARKELIDSEKASDRQRYAITLHGHNLRIFVRINDVPVFFKVIRQEQEMDFSFNEWLKSGLNIVKVSAEKFDDKSPSAFGYRIYYQSPSQVVAQESSLLYTSPPELNLPVRKPTGFVIRTIPMLRIWETEDIDFNRQERARLVDMINGFRSRFVEAVSHADDAFLATYNKMVEDEVLKAYGRPPEKEEEVVNRRREIAKTFRKEINAEVKASDPLKVSDLDFESIAGGRMVRVSRLDGYPLITVERGSLKFEITKPIYGRIGGVWEMLRDGMQ